MSDKPTKAVVTYQQWAMGRDTEFPPSDAVRANAYTTVGRVNAILADLDVTVEDVLGTHRANDNLMSSGYRPGHYNTDAGGAKGSAHLTGEAIDLRDPTGFLARKLIANLVSLRRAGLHMEAPSNTKGWVHLQTRAPKSGHLVFLP